MTTRVHAVDGLMAETADGRVAVASNFLVEPHFENAEPVSYRLQVAAFTRSFHRERIEARSQQPILGPCAEINVCRFFLVLDEVCQ